MAPPAGLVVVVCPADCAYGSEHADDIDALRAGVALPGLWRVLRLCGLGLQDRGQELAADAGRRLVHGVLELRGAADPVLRHRVQRGGGYRLDVYIALFPCRIGVVDNVDHGFLDGEFEVLDVAWSEFQRLAHVFHHIVDLRQMAQVVGDCEFPSQHYFLLLGRELHSEHGEVVALLCPTGKAGACFEQAVEQLLRSAARVLVYGFFHSLQAKLVVAQVHCLGKAIGVKQQCGTRLQYGLLPLKEPVLVNTKRYVGLHIKRQCLAIDN